MKVKLEFSGGSELLVGKQKSVQKELPAISTKWDLRSVIAWVRDNMVTERPDLLVQGETVRPGILVLVNDTDWELLGTLDYEIQENDTISFISTLHGG